MKPKILVNALMCPDGTIIQSHHRHDFKVHEMLEEEGFEVGFRSSIDGGSDYVRYNNGIPITITEDSPFEVIRMFLARGGRGKYGKEPLKYVPLFAMSNGWVEAVIEYEEGLRPDNMFLEYYIKEREYRIKNNIFIKEEE